MLERALEGLSEDQLHLRVRLMARIAGAKRDEPDRAPRDVLSAETVILARRSGDVGLLAYALTGRHAAMLGPSHALGAHEDPAELLEVAARAGNPELSFEGRMHQLVMLLEQGRAQDAVRVVDELDEIADHLHQPTHRWFVVAARANLALLHGRLGDAEDLISEAAQIGGRVQYWDAQGFADIQRFALRREQDRLDEMRERVDASLRKYPARPLFSCMAALLAVELDELGTARAIVGTLTKNDFADVPLNNDWSLSMFLLAEVIHGLGDADSARLLYEVMGPAAGKCVDTIEVCLGASDRALGLLAAAAGRYDDAVAHLEAALVINDRMGARPWAAHTRVSLATVLAQRGNREDRSRARRELELAQVAARDLGLHALERHIDVTAEHGDRRSTHPDRAQAGTRKGVYRCEGDYWIVGLDGAEHSLRGTKGLRHIATLLASPGHKIHVLDLVVPVDGTARRRGAHDPTLVPTSSAEAAILDARARVAYSERIRSLQADIDEAESWNDIARATRAQEELDVLVQELARASGLGRGARTFTSDAERARVNVTRAVRSAISKIREHDVNLASHLERSVRTGAFCSYEQDRHAPVEWDH